MSKGEKKSISIGTETEGEKLRRLLGISAPTEKVLTKFKQKALNEVLRVDRFENGIPVLEIDIDEAVSYEGEDEEPYLVNSYSEEISFIEFAIINGFFHDAYKKRTKEIRVTGYGTTDNIGRIDFGGGFDVTNSYWFNAVIEGDDNEYFFQTKMYIDGRGDLNNQFHITAKKGVNHPDMVDLMKKMKIVAFNNSEYKGQCIKVKLREGRFKAIEIIDIGEAGNELILNATQRKYVDSFINRVGRGNSARYLFNGEPGTGKTESIREIARSLIPNVTFIIPDFATSQDLTSIMEACEIFENSVIIMDDIDLYLGSRDNGSYTRLLGEFLSFFDGVKKRKISLLASTNDKGLVDKAAERPGRFNFTLDFTFLDEAQIEKVCNIHLDEKWRVQAVYDALSGTINGKKAKITGAFIANLADNIREMSEDDENWDIEDTVSLITESYKGFYSSQLEKEKSNLGFSPQNSGIR